MSDSDGFSHLSEGDIEDLDDPLSEEDKAPLTGQLRSLSRASEEVRYDTGGIGELKTRLVKEEISVPTPDKSRFRPSRFEVYLAFSMSGDRQDARTFGLVGKPLLYFTSIFVSLGVFREWFPTLSQTGLLTISSFRL